MAATTQPQVRRKAQPDYLMTVDAFVYAAAALLVLLAVEEAVGALLFTGVAAESRPEWTQVLGPLALVASIATGAIGAWRVHGRSLHGRAWLGMLIGLAGGSAVLALGFWVLLGVRGLLPRLVAEDSGPWDLITIVVVVTLAFLVPAVVMTFADLRGPRTDVRADRLRLVALGVALLFVAASLVVGGETAEAGIFAAGIGAAAAFSALGAAALERRS